LAALPGTSPHESGLAIDTPEFEEWKAVLARHDWQRIGDRDPHHFTFKGDAGAPHLGALGVRAFQSLWNRHNPTDQIAVDGRFGPRTRSRLLISPVEGFGRPRLLRLEEPHLEGDDVRALQAALVTVGIAGEVDGVFSEATDLAVRQFQEQRGLEVDGIAGPATRAALGLPA
jgi:peptidoglycan hydrolase-like protein with peptidoglycan-binding domain